jgi:prevent-host-death family protein
VPRTFSIADARDHLAKIVHEAETGPPLELTRRGKPIAMIVSVREFERLAGARGSFASALKRFRTKNDLKHAGIDPRSFRKLRDASPGRPVKI